MRVGELDQIVELQEPVEANNGGEITLTYNPVESVAALVMSQRGSEAFESARTNARETIRVKLRYRDDVLTTWRLAWMGQNYNIKVVDRSNRRKGELWLTAEVVGAL